MPRTCVECGSDKILSTYVGTEPEVASIRSNDIIIAKGSRSVAWCAPCWLRIFGRRAA